MGGSGWYEEADAYLTLVELASVQSAASQRVSMSLVLRPLSQALTAAVTSWADRSDAHGAGRASATDVPPSELLDEEAEPLESAIIAAAASAWRSHARHAQPAESPNPQAPSSTGWRSTADLRPFDLQQHLLEGSRCLGVRTGSCSGSALEAMLVGVTDCAVKHLHTPASIRGRGTTAAIPLCLLLRAESHCVAGWCTVLGAASALAAAINACAEDGEARRDLEPANGRETGASVGRMLEESVKQFTDELLAMSRRRAGRESSDAAEEHEVTVRAVAGAAHRARLMGAARRIVQHCQGVISKRSPSLLASIPHEDSAVQMLWGQHQSASMLLERDESAAEAEVQEAANRAAENLRTSASGSSSALDTLAVMPGLLPRLIRAVGNAHAAVLHNLACWAQGRGHGVQAAELLQWESSVRLLPLTPPRVAAAAAAASGPESRHQRWHSSPTGKPAERHRRLLLVPRDGVVGGAPLATSHGRDAVSSSLAFHRVLQPDGQRAAWESGNQAPTRPRLPPRPATARSLLSATGHAPGPSSRSKAHRRWSSAGPT
jgi:hypothetical protein